MYNRYIPQPDGSFRRSRVEEPSGRNHPQLPVHDPVPPAQSSPQPPPCPQEISEAEFPHKPDQTSSKPEQGRQHQSADSFLRQLLPKNLDTGDLMVIILLLLIAGDCAEERSNALLTLALYFIL